ncbi:MAG: amidase [Planctomycetes bacterium]|nr:amidase [Planctomycetota bacterium]
MSFDEIFLNCDATEMARLVREKQVSARELIETAISRAERLNPQLNAIIYWLKEEALNLADKVVPDAPFAGVPFLMKDILATVAGTPQVSGSRFLLDNVADFDTHITTRFRKAGLNIFGKTNTPEFGLTCTTEPEVFGACRNPWDLARTTGGSSGGAAAAIAARIVPAAHGNDGGGSIRIPASCCGLFGLKPTRGRVSMGPRIGDIMGGLVVEGVLSRSVRDTAALLDVISGPEPGDPYYAPPPDEPFALSAKRKPGRLRIAASTLSFTGVPVHDECKEAVRNTAKLLEGLGHHVEEKAPDISGELVSQAFIAVWGAGCAAAIDGQSKLLGRKLDPGKFETMTWALYEMGKQVGASDYLMAMFVLQGLGRELAAFLTDFDVWMTPTVAEPPPVLGTFDSPKDFPLQGLFRAAAFCPFTGLMNATGQPAMNVPLHWTADGLPVGVQFVSRYADEATLLKLATQLEEARPWADRLPPVH